MKLVTAILRPHVVGDVVAALQSVGVSGGTFTEVSGFGHQKGHTEVYRAAEYDIVLVPKARLEVVVDDADVDAVFKALEGTVRTGRIGDGKVWVVEVGDVMRLRTGERGAAAV
ncbi:P-II family nitrogen regulator [Nocardioides flavescens]|uniref:P-II family nitrogen regulator n=1 Tax=Nocardioides flavescens TaxID=2691959 RepID=A0A6L7EZ70_9ACTN|nr:P-II family nitrogen regulator [Nocardioides flavescens]